MLCGGGGHGMHGCFQGGCMVAPGGHAWLLRGACVVAPGGPMHGCSGGACMVARGACMVALGGHAWLLPGGVHGCSWGEPAWDTMRYGDTINERAVRILLECILVFIITSNKRLMPTSPTFVYREKSCTSTIKLISGCVRITQPPGICRVCSKIGCVYRMG